MCECNVWCVFQVHELSFLGRTMLTCALAVSPAHGKASGLEVFVQGKQIKAVTEFLLSRGVPKKWIELADLTGKK